MVLAAGISPRPSTPNLTRLRFPRSGFFFGRSVRCFATEIDDGRYYFCFLMFSLGYRIRAVTV